MSKPWIKTLNYTSHGLTFNLKVGMDVGTTWYYIFIYQNMQTTKEYIRRSFRRKKNLLTRTKKFAQITMY